MNKDDKQSRANEVQEKNPDAEQPPAGHTIDDHLYGDLGWHEHGPDADHDHDDFDMPLEDNPIWIQDNVTLRSVGIDIGSAGTQLVFSRLHLRRHGEDLTSRYIVVERDTLFQSPVRLTPYADEYLIDDAALGRIIDEAYGAAALHPDDIDTGIVILTGEALRRENAERIAAILAEEGGELVCATAGHHMEAMLAAYGSGAARASHDRGCRLLNIDIGGGTTKLGIVDKGRVVATAAFHVGGRLVVVDEAGRIARLDPAGRHHARQAGFDWQVGDQVAEHELQQVAQLMAQLVAQAVAARPLSEQVRRLFLTDPIDNIGEVDGVMFSGGVAEYVYGREEQDFGDLGKRLGLALRELVEGGAIAWPLLPAGECIRATALGASEYSIQLSGNTGTITSPGRLLPRRNLQVLQPPYDLSGDIEPDALAATVKAHFTAFDLDSTDADVALAFQWRGLPEYGRVRAFAEGIHAGVADRLSKGLPLYIMLDGDVAATLGSILKDELKIDNDILAIDGVILWDFDYIDLGRIRLPSNTVPVTIKSLVFSEDPRGPRPRQRLHHHEPGHHHHHHGHGQHRHDGHGHGQHGDGDHRHGDDHGGRDIP